MRYFPVEIGQRILQHGRQHASFLQLIEREPSEVKNIAVRFNAGELLARIDVTGLYKVIQSQLVKCFTMCSLEILNDP